MPISLLVQAGDMVKVNSDIDSNSRLVLIENYSAAHMRKGACFKAPLARKIFENRSGKTRHIQALITVDHIWSSLSPPGHIATTRHKHWSQRQPVLAQQNSSRRSRNPYDYAALYIQGKNEAKVFC